MSDSLDDFFAKRDKKKGSNKGKSQLTSEALVKELEEGAKLPDYPIRKDLKASALSSELLGLDADDADWRDFEDVDRKDYSGLKIQTISLEDQNEEELKRLQAERYEANLDASGPWNTATEKSADKSAEKSGDNTSAKPIEENKPAPEVPPVAPKAEPYRPPGERANSQNLERVKLSTVKRNRLAPSTPDISDQASFPSLG